MARLAFKGTGAAPGIGQGVAVVLIGPAEPSVRSGDTRPVATLPAGARAAEIARWRQALAEATEDLARLRRQIGERSSAEDAAVFEAQALFLQDPALLDPVEEAIRAEGLPAVEALRRVWAEAERDLEALDDPYLRARAADLRDVELRLALLLGDARPAAALEPGPDSIVIAHDLTPSDIAGLPAERVRGVVLAASTPTAHAAILARGLGLPLVVGAGQAILQVTPGQFLILDGSDGTVLVEPDARERERYLRVARAARQAVAAGARGEAEQPAVTQDGRRIALYANVGSLAEARQAHGNGAEGIGLLRTELLLASLPIAYGLPADEAAAGYSGSTHGGDRVGQRPDHPGGQPDEAAAAVRQRPDHLGGQPDEAAAAVRQRPDHLGGQPDEEVLAAAYGAILREMGQRPVVVRAMDAGGDKPLPALNFDAEPNPFLGWRGIRVLLDRRDLFAGQIRALLRAAAHHAAELRVMFPMVSSLEEFREAKHIVEAMRREGGAYARPLPIGVMIEVPAAALIAEALAREAEFFSLGTNDLVQYTLACDRGNARVSRFYQPLHPAVLRLIAMTVRAAHAAGRPVGVCGEMASDALAAPLLIGLGIDELSVGPDRLPALRQQIRALDYERLRQTAAEALELSTAQQIADLLARRR